MIPGAVSEVEPPPQHDRLLARLALASLITTLLLVMVGGYTRGSGSGYGCEDRWPLCEGGALGGLLPRAEREMIIEWSHRWLAATVGVLVLATAITAWRRSRGRPWVLGPAVAAVVTVGVQAWVGRMIVAEDLDADLVSLHLAISMAVVGLLSVLSVTSRLDAYGHDIGDRGWVRVVGAGAAGSYLLLLLGSMVHNRYFPGWPLMDGTLFPDLATRYHLLHLAHRTLAGIGIGYLGWLAWQARTRARPDRERRLVDAAAAVYGVNVLLGLAHVVTEVSSSLVVAAHLGVASVVWALLVATTTVAARSGAERSDAEVGSW